VYRVPHAVVKPPQDFWHSHSRCSVLSLHFSQYYYWLFVKNNCSNLTLQRAALHSGYLGLLLICGFNGLRLTGLLLASTELQSFNRCGQFEVNLCPPNHLLCSSELPLVLFTPA